MTDFQPDAPAAPPAGAQQPETRAAQPPETARASEAAGRAGGDPFSPWGVTFTPVSPNLTKVRLLSVAIWVALPTLGLAVMAFFVQKYSGAWIWVVPGIAALFLVWLLWLVPRQVRALGYAELEEDLIIRKGVMFKNLVVVPYGRMQYVDVNAGPIDRAFGVSSVQLHTASAATDASLPGLPPAEAARLRDRLATLGEARLAGL